MSSHGIRDRVAVVGMGCTPFGEHWNKGVDDLVVDSVTQALGSAQLDKAAVDAYWLGTIGTLSGLQLSTPLKLDHKPVTRVENFCASGSEAFRNACYAVASGAYDVAMAVGVEKLKDTGFAGINLPQAPTDGTEPTLSVPAMFSMLAVAYGQRYGVDTDVMRDVLSKLAVKNHYNGSLNPLAQFRTPVSAEAVACSPMVTERLGILDCSGIADGSAAAIVVRAEDAHRYTDRPLYVKGLALATSPGSGRFDPDYDFTTFPELVRAKEDAYRQAGVTDPRAQLALAEVHDCFTPTELIILEDLGFSERGEGWKDVLEGTFDLHGDLPVNPDGGLKSFGHPIGATGLRMLYECWLQLRGDVAGERAVPAGKTMGLVNNLGGWPGALVSYVAVLGSELG